MIQNENCRIECNSMPKLRKFVLFKDFDREAGYLRKPLSFSQRKCLANFRIGSFKLRVETLRYVRPKIPYQERFCLTCPNGNNEIENEEHFLFHCNALVIPRQLWLEKLNKPSNFEILDLPQKLEIALNQDNNAKCTARYISEAFDIRSRILFCK